jgi:hypothetical protein
MGQFAWRVDVAAVRAVILQVRLCILILAGVSDCFEYHAFTLENVLILYTGGNCSIVLVVLLALAGS